ncbi:MAG TPA: Ig-like domain-containing protein, partial [Gemmatimonadaceae bacterium]|nr:Ig-like domain-containing protein [Gemmatimonadaceae bacterium]
TASAGRGLSKAAALLLSLAVACSDGLVPPVTIPVASVEVTPPTSSLVVGEQVTLRAKPKAADGGELEREVTWASENDALATVSSSGVVSTIAVGTVAIRATSEGRVGRAFLTIEPVAPPPPVPVAEVRLSRDEEIVLAWDGETTITATALDADGNVLEGRAITWQSNRTNVAAVNHGTIYAISPGTATITAVSEGVPASIGVRVLEVPVTALEIVAVTTGIEVGDVLPFAARITRANGEVTYGPAEWSSSNPAIVSVNHSDISGAGLQGHAVGESVIRIARDGVSAALTLRVTAKPTHDLLYNRWVDDASEIMHMSLAEPGLVPVKLNAGNVSREPSPSPDGTQFVFAVSQELPTGEMQHDLYIVNRNGMNMRWLTRTAGVETEPQWSPDGSKILFRGVASGRSDLYTINVDGTGTTKLTGGLATAFSSLIHPAWSPDGSRIAFIGVQGSNHKVWTMNVDGSGLTQVTTDAGYDEFPAFSPDGQTIAFNRFNTQAPAMGDDIMLVPAQGGTPVRIALPGAQRSPAWSPDGGLIAFNGTAAGGQMGSEIYTIRADGTGLRLRTIDPAWGGGFNPAWVTR